MIASLEYNRNPQPLNIQGASHISRALIAKLESTTDADQRGALFHDFMDVRFQLHQWQREDTRSSRKSLKNSYLRFLRGWLFDSNSLEGAVLKGWVESRLGLLPTFHHEVISSVHCDAYNRYMIERMQGATRSSSIFAQLDLLYSYIQYELERDPSKKTHLPLFRGINDLEEHNVVAQTGKHRYQLCLNNLNSFTSDYEKAWEFGIRVLKAEIPLTKILFLSGILPKALFKGENEFLVIGGVYDVEVMIG